MPSSGKRRELQRSAGSMEDYLRSLKMQADVREIDEADLMRVVQLLGKTNQFNLTTRRHSREDVLRLLALPDAVGLTVRVADRFGDHGLIGVLIAAAADDDPRTLRVDTWLMSCRVIGRTVEEFFVAELLEEPGRLGYRRILGEYIPTKKNALVADLYDRMGFRRVEAGPDGSVHYELAMDQAPQPVTYLLPKPATCLIESA